MEMETTVTKTDDVTVLEINGPLNINTFAKADDCINKILEEDNVKLLINLKDTTVVSSASLKVLLSAAKKMRARKSPLTFCSPNPNVQEVFSISGFESVVNIGKTEEEALNFLEDSSPRKK